MYLDKTGVPINVNNYDLTTEDHTISLFHFVSHPLKNRKLKPGDTDLAYLAFRYNTLRCASIVDNNYRDRLPRGQYHVRQTLLPKTITFKDD